MSIPSSNSKSGTCNSEDDFKFKMRNPLKHHPRDDEMRDREEEFRRKHDAYVSKREFDAKKRWESARVQHDE